MQTGPQRPRSLLPLEQAFLLRKSRGAVFIRQNISPAGRPRDLPVEKLQPQQPEHMSASRDVVSPRLSPARLRGTEKTTWGLTRPLGLFPLYKLTRQTALLKAGLAYKNK